MEINKIIEHASQLTPSRLTALLQARGILSQGRVEQVSTGEPRPAFGSAIWRLEVDYSNDAPLHAPRRLFLKCANPTLAPGDFNPEHLSQEIIFYQTVAPMMNAPFLIPAYAVGYDPHTGSSHLLMLDVADTHIACQNPAQTGHCESAVAVLAQQHAFWWDHPLLGTSVGRYPSADERAQNIEEAIAAAARFVDEVGEQLPAVWRANYEQVLSALPRLYRRHASGHNLTLVHGDAHLGNFLFPRGPHPAQTYLLDWQFWHPTIGGTDLAFMMAVEWEPALRRGLEQQLLQHYHHTLLSLGVQSYPWETCWDDYRLSVILVSIFIPIWQRVVFGWKVNLASVERSMTAFEDLQCRELLEE